MQQRATETAWSFTAGFRDTAVVLQELRTLKELRLGCRRGARLQLQSQAQ